MPFQLPTSIAVSPAGIVYVASLSPAYLWGFDTAGELRAVEGDEAGYTSPITSYRDLAASARRGLFVLEADSRRVFFVDPAHEAADGTLFMHSWLAEGGAEQQALDLTAIAVGADDMVYLVDAAAARVLKLDAGGTLRATWDIPRPEGVDWQLPDSIVVDRAGESYVGWATTVVQFDARSKVMRAWQPVDAAACDTTNGPEFGHRGIGGLAVGDGLLYIADEGCGPAHTGAQVRVVGADGRQRAAWPIPSGSYPERLALDAQGRVYCIANIIHGGGPGSVLVFAPDGRIVMEWTGAS
jgi:sugar lactone lactonase YvrE